MYNNFSFFFTVFLISATKYYQQKQVPDLSHSTETRPDALEISCWSTLE